MVVEQLLLHQFRHFSRHLTFHHENNLLIGHNGSGKTSILEALYYLAYAKSFGVVTTKQLPCTNLTTQRENG